MEPNENAIDVLYRRYISNLSAAKATEQDVKQMKEDIKDLEHNVKLFYSNAENMKQSILALSPEFEFDV